MTNAKLLNMALILGITMSFPVQAKLYKWVDDKGTTHYGEVIPPEFANKDRDTIKKSGMMEKRPEKIDPEAVRAKEIAEKQRAIEKRELVEQERRNSTLLNTYSNEKEIDMARDRSLILIKARIESNNMLLKSTQTSLEELQKEAEARTKVGKAIPVSLSKDIAQTEARSSRYATELANSEAELDVVKKRFEEEKVLYRKLKGTVAQ